MADRASWARRLLVLLAATAVTASTALSYPPTPLPLDARPGYRPAAYAIKRARIVTGVGKAIIEDGAVVVRNGVIEAVGPTDKVAIPYDAEVIDGQGTVVYPGFLDLYTTLGMPKDGVARSRTGPSIEVKYSDYALPRTPADNRFGLTPEFEVATVLDLPDSAAQERRALGFTDLVAAPAGSIATGQSALVSLSGQPRREVIVRSPIALHVNLRPPTDLPRIDPEAPPDVARRRLQGTPLLYPMSLMGVVAHLRQAMLDAEHDNEAQAYFDKNGGPRPPYDPTLKTLHAAQSRQVPVWWEANTRDEIHRALDLAAEFGTSAVIVGGREAGKVADRLKAENVPVVLRVDFPDEPKAPTEAEYRKREPEDQLDPLKVLAYRESKWKERVGTAKALADAGVRFAFSTDGLTRPETFHAQTRKAIAAGLSRDAAVNALTRDAAEIAGLGAKLGTIEPGKLGHIVAMSAPYGDEKAKVRYILADGLKFDAEKPTPTKKAQPGDGKPKPETKPEPSKSKESPKGETTKTKADPEPKSKADAEPAKAKDQPKSKADAEPAKAKDQPKSKADPEPAKAKDQPRAKSEAEPAKTKDQPRAKAEVEPATSKDQPRSVSIAAPQTKQVDDKGPTTPFVDVATEFDEDRLATLKTGGDVLIKDATILTAGPAGTIVKGSILVKGGKIVEVGETVAAPPGVAVIEAAGMVAMPGIIDSHSHMAIQGDVNEMSLSIVPEVRVRDVVVGDDPTIFRALAGGVTTARLLHGSADTIGGQDAVIKLKHGKAGRDLILKDAPRGVKFALGENVIRRTGRFPNTRMGVEATIERAFDEARAYQAEWDAYNAARTKALAMAEGAVVALAPRRDLRLEALVGALDGSIKIHCHCYRSDEILMLLRVAARYGVTIRSLQHALEGYKVAAEIAEHGASASTFSDWWAYKVEAADAIPFNSALLADAGVHVCIKSDDEELVRRLYAEAAKIIKYGGVKEARALEMITLNPARQLGLDHRIGSIEVGKDADIAIFNAHPFDGFARCQYTLIDGEVYFQRTEPSGKSPLRPGSHVAMPAVPATRTDPLEMPADAKGAFAIVGATLHPVSGPNIEEGVLVVKDGKIVAIGGSDAKVPEGAQVVDARGLEVWPGLIDGGTILGLIEIGSLRETHDFADSALFEPELRTSTALHPDSKLVPVTRANGVLMAYVQPTGGAISGQGCVIALNGWVPSEMVMADRAALNVNIPSYTPPNPDVPRSRMSEGTSADPAQRRRDRIEAIKEQFRRALAYHQVMTEARARKETKLIPDPRMAALVPYAKGEKPVIFRAERTVEILDALAIIEELKLKGVISGGIDAWKVAGRLKAAKVPVLIGGVLRLPLEPTDPYDAPYANAARLHEAGVVFAIRSGGSGADQATSSRNLPYEAAMAVAYGLPETEALKAVTIGPAKILGVADQVGSLEVGKLANIVITAGHILQPTTEVKGLFINGKPLTPASEHTRLYSLYQQRLAEVRAGNAPLGLEPTAAKPASTLTTAPTPPIPTPAPTTTPTPAATVPGPAVRN